MRLYIEEKHTDNYCDNVNTRIKDLEKELLKESSDIDYIRNGIISDIGRIREELLEGKIKLNNAE